MNKRDLPKVLQKEVHTSSNYVHATLAVHDAEIEILVTEDFARSISIDSIFMHGHHRHLNACDRLRAKK